MSFEAIVAHSHATATATSVHEVSDWAEIEPLRAEWNELLSRSPADTPFLRHEWLGLWWSHFGAGRRLAILLARRAGRLVAVLPLLEHRVAIAGIPVTELRSLTNGHSFRFNAIGLPHDDEAWSALWSYLRSRVRPWQVIRFEEVPEDAPVLARFLETARADRASVGTWRGAEVPYLSTEGSWDEYHASLSRNMRANLRKKERRLAEEGEVTYRCIHDPTEADDALEQGLALEASGWKAREGSAIVSSPILNSFYTRWAQVAAENGWLRLSLLYVKGEPVAFDFSTLYGGRYFDLKMGYDPAWDRFSVGQILKAHILRGCFETDIREYDFLGASMRAKDDWSPRKRGHDWHFIYRRGLVGRLLHFVKFTAAPAAKRMFGT